MFRYTIFSHILIFSLATSLCAMENDPSCSADQPKVRTLRVIIADDDSINLRIMARFVTNSNHRVVKAVSNGQELVEAVETNECDVVFSDGHMPVLNGLDAVKEIRLSKKKLPIYIVTAENDEFCEQCLKHGASGIVSKPVNMEKFRKILNLHQINDIGLLLS